MSGPNMMPGMAPRIMLCAFIAGLTLVRSGLAADVPGLRFVSEPPGRVEFANTRGAQLSCTATGTPTPTVNWTLTDGSSVVAVAGLRELGAGGQLVFSAFGADRYRPDVHAAVYRCVASNAIGVIHSRDVNVYGVVVQSYDAQVYDTYVMEGNTAVMKCHVPAVVGDYLTVVAWIRNDSLHIRPPVTAQGSELSKYAVLPSGDLHVRNVTSEETSSKYKCKTRHDLTGDERVSTTAGSLFVTEPRGNMQPRILEGSGKVEVKVGGNATLACISQGNPSPVLSWFRKIGQGELVSVDNNVIYEKTESYLQIRMLQMDHAGVYVCEAANELGKDRLEISVIVHKPVTVSIRPRIGTAKVGDNMTYVCESSGPSPLTVSWLHDGRVVKGAVSPELRLSPVRISDQGLYQCRVRSDKVTEHAEAELRLSEIQPQHQETFAESTVAAGSTLSLRCSASGIPRPVFEWTLDNVPVATAINSTRLRTATRAAKNGTVLSVLHVTKAVASDGGVYACIASNVGGLSKHVARVSIPGKLAGREIKNMAAVSGSNVYLNCPYYGHPVTEIIWSKDGSRPLQVSRNLRLLPFANGTLLVKKVHAGDGGVYQCTVRNSVGQTAVGKIEMQVIVPPKIVPFEFQEELLREGMRARLQCVVSEGDLPLNVTWLKDGRPISPALGITVRALDDFSSILTLSSITPAHNGQFTCVASNMAATVTHSAQLSVNAPPKIIPFAFLDDQFYKGMRAHVTCAISQGDLPVTFDWLKDGQDLPRGTVVARMYDERTASLSIETVGSAHSGNYTCVARNGAGAAAHTAQLLVRVPPKIVPFSFGDSLSAGAPARVVCGLQEGDAPVRFSWSRDGVPVVGTQVHEVDGMSSVLSFARLTPAHAGTYRCTAENVAGASWHDAPLRVNVAPKIVPFAFQGDHVFEGALARLTCVVYQGDLPLEITWEKDGGPITAALDVTVRGVDTYTSILTIDHVRSHHGGNYSCVARNQAASASHTAPLVVNVPPKIVPFAFQEEHLVEGQLARVSCTVSRGDLPLKLNWEKDGVVLAADAEGVQIRSLDEYSSILTVTRVSAERNGLYTCVATNLAGLARHSTELVANVPPKWVTEPQDVSAVVGTTVSLHCKAEGYPTPSITWSFAKTFETLLLDPKSVEHLPQTRIESNGTLVFDRLESANEGYFICSASNGIGSNLEAVVQVKINAPPHFKKLLTDVRISWKKNVQLQCEVNGNRPLNVTWWKDGKTVKFEVPRVTEQLVNHTHSVLSTLTIHNLIRNDSGLYTCNATNVYGKNVTTAEITVLEPPDAPFNLSAASVASTTIELSWKPFFDGNDPIKKYIIQYKVESDSWDSAVSMETVNGVPTNTIIAQLLPATSYLFRVFAENLQGRSGASKILAVTTEEDVPTGVPSDVQIESVNAETFRVTWKAPDHKSWNGKLLGYHVGHKEVDVGDSYKFKSLLNPVPRADASLAVEIGELRQFTKYAVVVQMYNTRGKGPLSEAVVAMTSEGVPSQAPTNVRCTTLTSHSIHVTWTPPPPDTVNGILRGYKVSYRPASDWFEDMADSFNVSLLASLTLTSMNKFSNYSIQVLAMTKVGEGPSSSAIFCKTLDDSPEAPSDIKAAALSPDSVIVSWKPPSNPNGMLKSYSIYWKNAENEKGASVNSAPAMSGSQEVSGLKEGARYDFWVTASTLAGEGQASRVVRQGPVGPKVPTSIISFDDKIITAWQSDVTLPCLAVGIPKPQIKWIHKDAVLENGDKVSIGSDGMLTVANVLEADAGDYSCNAANEISEDRITYTVIVLAPPSAPTTELLATTASSIHVQWTPPPSSKLSKIKGYTVHYRKDGASDWKELTLGAVAVDHRLENLDCGTRYEVYVTPFNKIGIGAPSEILVASTNGSVPAAPAKEDLMEEASNSVSLYLNTWKSNGCPVLHFTVEYSPRSINEWSLVSDNVKPEQRRLVVPGLRPATWYGLRMTASNGAGSTVAEYSFATLTSAGATVSPDLQSDAAAHEVEGLLAYLNFYLVVPVICMMVVLFAILGAACFYVKVKKREQQSDRANRASTVSASLMHGTRSGSFSYVQRAAHNRSGNHSRLQEDELSPYATFHLANHRGDNLGRHSNVAPPLPPPRMFDGYPQDSCLPMNPNYSPAGNGFLPGHGPVETTFIFPRLPAEDHHVQHCMPNFPPRGYPVDELNSKFA